MFYDNIKYSVQFICAVILLSYFSCSVAILKTYIFVSIKILWINLFQQTYIYVIHSWIFIDFYRIVSKLNFTQYLLLTSYHTFFYKKISLRSHPAFRKYFWHHCRNESFKNKKSVLKKQCVTLCVFNRIHCWIYCT